MITVASIKQSLFGVVVFVGVLLVGLVGAPAVFAQSPWWHLTSNVRPANLPPGGEGTIVVRALNTGDGATSGAVTLDDVLPAGVSVQGVSFYAFGLGGGGSSSNLSFECETQTGGAQCTYPEFFPVVNPYEYIEMRIAVKVEAAAVSGSESRAEVSGGAAPSMSLGRPLRIEGGPIPFGVEDLSLVPEEEGGTLDARAGSHPFQLTATLALNSEAETIREGVPFVTTPALARGLRLELPAGLVGNATALPRCSEADFAYVESSTGNNLCPENTAVGVAAVTVDEAVGLGIATLPVPIFNLVPAPGEPARFGFIAVKAPVLLDASVRSGGDYGVTVSASNITQLPSFLSTEITFWGVPGDPRHDQSRGWGCLVGGHWQAGGNPPCTLQGQSNPPASDTSHVVRCTVCRDRGRWLVANEG